MGRTAPTKAGKHPVEAAPAAPINGEVPHIDTHRASRSIPRDAAVVIVLHTTLNKAVHLHDPIEPQEADRIFAFAVNGLADRMLLPVLTSGQHVLEGGDLSFQRDSQPVAPSSDRHASKLVRKRLKRRKQGYASAVKMSIYGNYAASRASSRTESRFGGSRFGGSRASAAIWGAVSPSKVPRMSLIYGLHSGGESVMNSSWISSQQGSTGTASNNASWLPGTLPDTKISSPPPSVAGTARVAVDFIELQRRADIECDLNTRESVRRSKDEINRKSDLRLKLRSLADPTVSLEKEEGMMTALGTKGLRSRLQQSRQGNRAKDSRSFDGKRVAGPKGSTPANDETTTFRTEDYEGLTSDVVLFSKSGELLVGENCFVVEQRHRQELLLDLQTGGVVQPRIQLVATPKPDDEIIPDENIPQQPHSSPPLRSSGASASAKHLQVMSTSDFDGQMGSFESSPRLALDLQATPLAKGVVLKLPDTGAARALAAKIRKPPTKKSSKRAPIPETQLAMHLGGLIQAPDASKSALGTSQSDSELQTRRSLSTAAPLSALAPSAQPLHTTKPSGTGQGSLVLPKHIVRIFHNGEKLLQSLRIRTPACPNRLSRKTPSRGSLFVDRDEYEWDVEGMGDLFSLQDVIHHSSASSLPTVKYVREFPKPPQGHIQVFGAVAQNLDWKLPNPSPFSFHPRTTTVLHER